VSNVWCGPGHSGSVNVCFPICHALGRLVNGLAWLIIWLVSARLLFSSIAKSYHYEKPRCNAGALSCVNRFL
jgi:hypothetical protein